MKELVDCPVHVGLSYRQKQALTVYARGLGVSVSEYVRQLITDDVPRECYRPLPAPPGQMQLEGVTPPN